MTDIAIEDEVVQSVAEQGKPGFNDADIITAKKLHADGADATEIALATGVQLELVEKYCAVLDNPPEEMPAVVEKKAKKKDE